MSKMLLKQFFPDVLLILCKVKCALLKILHTPAFSVAFVKKRRSLLLVDLPSALTVLYICTKMGKLRNLVLNLFSHSLKFMVLVCLDVCTLPWDLATRLLETCQWSYSLTISSVFKFFFN